MQISQTSFQTNEDFLVSVKGAAGVMEGISATEAVGATETAGTTETVGANKVMAAAYSVACCVLVVEILLTTLVAPE